MFNGEERSPKAAAVWVSFTSSRENQRFLAKMVEESWLKTMKLNDCMICILYIYIMYLHIILLYTATTPQTNHIHVQILPTLQHTQPLKIRPIGLILSSQFKSFTRQWFLFFEKKLLVSGSSELHRNIHSWHTVDFCLDAAEIRKYHHQPAAIHWWRKIWTNIRDSWCFLCQVMIPIRFLKHQLTARRWFQIFVFFTPKTEGNDPIWLIFFGWVGSTTNSWNLDGNSWMTLVFHLLISGKSRLVKYQKFNQFVCWSRFFSNQISRWRWGWWSPCDASESAAFSRILNDQRSRVATRWGWRRHQTVI